LPTDFKKFTEVFLSSHTYEADNFWGWVRWETFPEDEAIFIDTDGKLERFYAIRSIKLLKEKTIGELENIDLNFDNEDFNRDLALLAKNENFKKFLDDIVDESEKWEFILDQDEINSIDKFKRILVKAEDLWDEIEQKKIREVTISNAKIEEFKDEMIKEFNRLSLIRRIFHYYNLVEDKTNEKNDSLSRFGINRVDDKAAFFEDWHVQYVNWGIEYGRMMARGENSFLFKKISNLCKLLDSNINDILENLDPSQIIMICTGKDFYSILRDQGNFYSKRHRESPKSDLNSLTEFRGYYQFKKYNIPVFGLNTENNKKILILKKSDLGRIIQYSPLNDEDNSDYVKDLFYINIRAFSDYTQLIDEFLNESIDWLEEKGGEIEQRKFLEQKVWIQIYERFKYENVEDIEGFSIDFNLKLHDMNK